MHKTRELCAGFIVSASTPSVHPLNQSLVAEHAQLAWIFKLRGTHGLEWAA